MVSIRPKLAKAVVKGTKNVGLDFRLDCNICTCSGVRPRVVSSRYIVDIESGMNSEGVVLRKRMGPRTFWVY